MSAWRLLDGIRAFSRRRVAWCRAVRIAPTVQLQRRTDGGTQLAGLHKCASVWSCPVCSGRICAERAAEVEAAAEAWTLAGGRLQLLTLTARHHAGSDLERQRRGVAEAWRMLWQGRGAKDRRERWGIRHTVRALEATHGASGWHPHLHVLAFVTSEGGVAERELSEEWQSCVLRALGSGARPTLARGADVREVDAAAGGYLAKLGLAQELTSIATKDGAGRTPWQIALDAAAGCRRSIGLWQQWSRAMVGARQLTWSRGALRAFSLRRLRDEQALERAEPEGVGHPLAEWEGRRWDRLRRSRATWISECVAAGQSEHWATALRAFAPEPRAPPGTLKTGHREPMPLVKVAARAITRQAVGL